MVSCGVWTIIISELVLKCMAKSIKLNFNVNQVFKDQKLPGLHKRADISSDISNLYYIYTTDLYLGSNKQHVIVQVDTGSSDTWVVGPQNCNDCAQGGTFNPATSTTFRDLKQPFGISYADGSGATGNYGVDSVQVEQTVSIPFQFGIASSDSIGWGVLALGQVSLETTHNKYANYISALKLQGQISKAAYSLYLNDVSASTGTVIFGGYDTQKYFGSLVKLPITSNQVSVKLDGVTVSRIEYLSRGESVILDSGTSYSLLPGYLVNDIANALGAKKSGNVLVAPCNQPSDQYVTFNFDGVTINVPYSGLVSYQHDSTGQKLSTCSLDVSEGNILGDNFLRHAYVVYDYDDQTISLAQVRYSTTSRILDIL